GRSPKINEAGGRDHWGNAGFVLLGGGGLRGGAVVGSTTSRGEGPEERIVWPQGVLAPIYTVFGINSGTELPRRLGRPANSSNLGRTNPRTAVTKGGPTNNQPNSSIEDRRHARHWQRIHHECESSARDPSP